MKCPHCIVEINPNFSELYLGADKDGNFSVFIMNCPNEECKKLIIELKKGEAQRNPHSGGMYLTKIAENIFVRPLKANRPPVPIEVDTNFAVDYNEACLILPFSPKASAALSRRCLQNILRDKALVKKGDLSNEIQEVIDSGKLPSHLIESIDAIRNIGNFAAHPNKSMLTGEIIEVEFGEAEWLLDVLEALFDFYFVQPKIIQMKRQLLNQKLAEMGKPEMK
ncbi:MAG: DUF4145 domain-containing protein [Saprospiraceae bacterium]|jgi:hypothetical protein